MTEVVKQEIILIQVVKKNTKILTDKWERSKKSNFTKEVLLLDRKYFQCEKKELIEKAALIYPFKIKQEQHNDGTQCWRRVELVAGHIQKWYPFIRKQCSTTYQRVIKISSPLDTIV